MTTSTQFSDPRLVAAYDAMNALGEDGDFFRNLVEKLPVKTIIDLGCGTGLLTCDLVQRGFTMIGIEPAPAMIDIARHKPHADKVQWIVGGYEQFTGREADMVLMTSHVAQFFLQDEDWQRMLEAAHNVLHEGGYIAFDSRTPIFPPYQSWPTESNPRRVEAVSIGPVDWYYKLLEINGNRVRYELHFDLMQSGEHVVSTDELIFRSQEDISQSLVQAGFNVETVYGDWDGSMATPTSPEMIFVAKKK